MPARTAFSDDLRWDAAALGDPLMADLSRAAAEPATMMVTIQVTLPGVRAGDPAGSYDPLGGASQLAGRLHDLAARSAREVAVDADVNTTVSLVVERPGSVGARPAADAATPVAPAQRRPLFARPPAATAPDLGQPPVATPAPATLRIDTSSREAVLDGTALVLTRREYELLLFLATRPGRVFTRPQLLKWVWGHEVVSGERTVDVHVRRLRA
ncbi:MAG: putative two component transcriptional regulator, winged helix family, partial [Actinomycetia bacterium]|nr:putative two component transcriptional regulator, winged helix family [Actinomycetes bacterium]